MEHSPQSHSLTKLRGALVSTLMWLGVWNLVLVIAGAVLLSFALDVSVELPWLLRALGLVGAVALYIAAVRRNHRRLRVSVPAEDLLATVEQGNPTLEGHLMNVMELGAELRASDPAVRRGSHDKRTERGALESALLRRAVAESRGALGKVSIERSLDLTPLRARRGLALALVGLVLLCALLSPRSFILWGKRNLLLSTTPWPRATHFALDNPEPVWHRPRKEPVHIDAWVLGEIPRAVELELRSAGESRTARLLPGVARHGTWTLASESTHGGPAPDEESEGRRLSYVLPRVLESFSFTLEGGDNRTYPVRVEVHDPPRVMAQRVVIHPPQHTRVPGRTIENPAAEIAVVEGSTIEVIVEIDQPVTEAWARLGDAARSEIGEIDGNAVRHRMQVVESGFLEIGYRGGDWGFAGTPVRLALASYPDLTPQVTLSIEGDNRLVTSDATIACTVRAEDDFGLTDLALELVRLDVGAPAAADGDAPGDGGVDDATEATGSTRRIDLAPWTLEYGENSVVVAVSRSLSVTRLGMEPGAEFSLQALATDNDEPAGFKTARSNVETFTVLAPDKLLEKLDMVRTEAQTRLEELAFAEGAVRDALERERARRDDDVSTQPFEQRDDAGERRPSDGSSPSERQPGQRSTTAESQPSQQSQREDGGQPGESRPREAQPGAQQPGQRGESGERRPQDASERGETQPNERQDEGSSEGRPPGDERRPQDAGDPSARQPNEGERSSAQSPTEQQGGERQTGERQTGERQDGEQRPQDPNAPSERQPTGDQQPNEGQQPSEGQEPQGDRQDAGERQPSTQRQAGERQPSGQQQPGDRQPDEQQPQDGSTPSEPSERQPDGGQQPQGEQQPGERQSNDRQQGARQPGGRQQPGERQPNAQQPGEQQPGERQPGEQAPQDAGAPSEQQPAEGRQPNEDRQQSPRSPSQRQAQDPDAARQARLDDLARRQEEIAREAREITRMLNDMQRVMDQNQLGSDAERRRFEDEVARPLDELTEESLPRSARDIEAIPESSRRDEDLDRAEREAEAIARKLDQIARRLEGTQKFRDILNRLQIILEVQDQVIRETEREVEEQ